MAALDLAEASASLTVPGSAFTSLEYGAKAWGDLFGDPLSTPHPIRVVDGIPGIPRRAATADVQSLYLPDVVSPLHGATFVAVRGQFDAESWYSLPGVEMCYYTSSVITSQLASAYVHDESLGSEIPLTTPHVPDGIAVYAFVNSSSEAFIANSLDGVLATGPAVESAPGGTNGSMGVSYSDEPLDILGIWHFADIDVSQAQAIETLAAIVALLEEYVPPQPFFTATITIPSVALSAELDLDALGADDTLPAAPTPGGSATIPSDPTPDPAPALLAPIRHIWEEMPAPTMVDGRPVLWTPTATGHAPYGYLQIVANGTDVSAIDGVPTPRPEWSDGEPFAYGPAVFTFPTLNTLATLPSWAKEGANFTIRIARCNASMELTGVYEIQYRGIAVAIEGDDPNGPLTITCTGLLYGVDLQKRKTAILVSSKDIGTVIPAALNSAAGRRYDAMAKKVTGVKTAVSGGGEPLLTGYIQQLLATALYRGKIWTVACDDKTPELRPKDLTTIHMNVRSGQRGVDINLTRDASQAPNIIFGRGVNKQQGRWGNWKFPNQHPDDAPLYPLGPSQIFHIGLRDSQTTSGRGVSDAQERLGRPVTGTWNAGDVKALRREQDKMGITVDGDLGPQSWAAMFDVGANTGSIDGAFQAPLAALKEVRPRLIGPDGADLGPNPAYDDAILPVEEWFEFGFGVSKQDAIRWAREYLKRVSNPGWFGTITFNGMSPKEMPAIAIRSGMNIKVKGHRGSDIVLHIAHVRKRKDGSVVLTVDTNARDYPTLAATLRRDRNSVDPAKAAVKRILMGSIGTDRPLFDAEGQAGVIPRHAVNGGYWSVRRIWLGQIATISDMVVATDDPRKFAICVFNKKVTARQLNAWVGNPLTATTDPWADENLDDRGLVYAAGWKQQPNGYSRGTFSDPNGETGATLTGKYIDDMSWQFASESGWAWVGIMTQGDCYAWGRMRGLSGVLS